MGTLPSTPLPPEPSPPTCCLAPIHGAQGKPGMGEYCPGEQRYLGPVCGNTSPGKLPPSHPLLREQRVCFCNSGPCISPQPGSAGPALFPCFPSSPWCSVASTFPENRAKPPEKQNRTPSSWKPCKPGPWWPELSVEYFMKYLHCKNDRNVPAQALLCCLVPLFLHAWTQEFIFLPHCNTAKIREFRT